MIFSHQLGLVKGRVKDVLGSVREITADERKQLERNGNVVTGTVLVSKSGAVLDNVRNNVFLNTVVLSGGGGACVKVDGDTPALVAGVLNSTLSDVMIDGSSIVKDCAMVHSVYVGSDCALISCGVVTGKLADAYGTGSELVLCEETGSRAIVTSPDLTLESAVAAISSKREKDQFVLTVGALKTAVVDGDSSVTKFIGCVVMSQSLVLRCNQIRSVFFASKTKSIAADLSKTVLHYGASIDSAIVHNSVVGKGVSVSGFAVVENSILCDFSKISVHAKVVHSLVGSYSGVESGECASSLIGPFVGFHHQSLCIATYWPGGRGNIGYGANVGSNHSGKAPDCELLVGEGVFFGLATVIKFPANFTKAVYSLIASGVTCLPQRVEMPFSLINSGSLGGDGLNEIMPAWVLSDNMFTLIRNEDKFKKRQKSDATVVYEHEIFRPEIIDLVLAARDKLLGVVSKGTSGIYTESDIEGLGKNYLREGVRMKAIDTYSFIVRWYALRGLYRRVEEVGVESVVGEGVADSVTASPACWNHCKSVLLKERMNLTQIKSLLEEFSKLDFLVSTSCVASKSKDDVRGAKVVGPTYAEFHSPASEHPVCVSAKRASSQIEIAVTNIVAKL